MNTIHIIIVIALALRWPLYQLNVKDVFLHRDLEDEIYINIFLQKALTLI